MAEKGDKPSERPFHVVTDTGGLHSGHVTELGAANTADRANKDAEELGIKTRYKAIPKP